MKVFLCITIFTVFLQPLSAQNTDSLENLLTSGISDSQKKDILIELCKEYRDSNPNAMRLYAEELVTLSKKDTTSNSFAWAHYYLGDYYYLVDDFDKTEKYFLSAYEIFKNRENSIGALMSASSLANIYFFRDRYKTALNFAESGLDLAYVMDDKAQQSNLLALICDIYTYMERYNLAIQHCIQSLKIKEEMEIQKGKEITLNTIGLIYQELGTYKKAKEYLFEALALARENGEPYNIATTHSNIGNYYLATGSIEDALQSFQSAMKIDSSSQDKTGLAYSFYDIGKVYLLKDELTKAIENFKKAKELADEQNMPELEARIGLEMGGVFITKSEFQIAIQELKNSVTIAQKINSSGILKDTYQKLSKLYDKMGDKTNALIYMKLFMLESERKFKEENIRSIAEIEALYNIDKKEKEIDLLKKDNAIKELQAEQRSFFITALSIGLFLLTVLLIILYNRNKLKNRANKALNEQNKAIQEQKEEIENQKEELAATSNKLVDKNQEVTDSIVYAKQIQDSLLPQLQTIKEVLPQSFIFFRPRDIVSGDFYWFTQIENKTAIAVVDCTGHGVPGAFMTVLANSLLNQIVLETGITSPDLIVSLLDQKIQQNLHQQQLENANTDGLDIGLVLLDPQNKTIEYSGAKIPLYHYQDNELQVIKSDRNSVGSTQQLNKSFTKKEIKYKPGDMIFMSSDGFQDQFGGPKNKKFMKSNFRKLLSKIAEKPGQEQLNCVEEQFIKWRGSNPQTDDILVIGFKLN
ncbi:tetratricopeptide repeat protein [Marivirga harenae]|mgnify:CR=1 FL=1|uniref:tetratricopeptide repeat protein n=1 Tax=Marivirga harenae TaxID=2010992 RepID=UPI0026E0C8BD|nr:tetratricopeptide repeat protein [Marivirga harenae]WKV12872.1 tetratricopeptide repeat protein [Marivirga harenae]|tara:strand:- start:3200 stop:5458 length:2259 start_codon:yes stop_codon:yes gene_type:complete